MAKKLTIILDIDDVLMDFVSISIEMLAERGITLSLNDVTSWDFVGLPDDVRHALYETFSMDELYDRQRPVVGAVEMVNRLREAGHHIVFASAVQFGKMQKRAEQIMEYFHADPKDIMLGGQKFLLQGDILLDDSLDNVLKSHCTYPVVRRKPWNHTDDDVLVVDDLVQFESLVRTIARK